MLSCCLDLRDTKLQWLLLKSLDLFESVINSRWFLRTSFVLFLTGLEEFKVKLLKVRYNSIHVLLLLGFLPIPLGSPREFLLRIHRGRGC
jgi:hypothetical protein